MIGLGDIGSSTIQSLAGAGVGNIGIVDQDTVALSNLQRQTIYSFKDIGKKKVEVVSTFVHELNNNVKIDKYDFYYTKDEIDILKKISEWPKCVNLSSNKLEPHRIPTYLYELASLFHSYWNLGKDNPKKRFINDQKKISDDKLVFLKAISNVIKSGMDIVGVSVPEKM